MVEVEVACTTAEASEGGGRAETAAAKAGVEGAPFATRPHLSETIPAPKSFEDNNALKDSPALVGPITQLKGSKTVYLSLSRGFSHCP